MEVNSLEDLKNTPNLNSFLDDSSSIIKFIFPDKKVFKFEFGSYYPILTEEVYGEHDCEIFFNKLGITNPCKWVNSFYKVENNDLENEKENGYDPEGGFPESEISLDNIPNKVYFMFEKLYELLDKLSSTKIPTPKEQIKSPLTSTKQLSFLPRNLGKDGFCSVAIRIK